ncbi:two-component sensor histidine kinase [Bacillus sp. J14TS2]|uniref:ATP-binding protein n=1 Tax=Bacillus sp. J14TS2 TaxID=2807188 RepID=UPI001B0E2ACD|nr:ATP-binding protein [Bacillus sp. J14TS2]GIN74740.1 two-component sensor histidine kinase [Bacillus sp. J14TS2]
MRFRDFLVDRLTFIVLYLFNTALILCIVKLSLLEGKVFISTKHLLYISLLSFLLLLGYLTVDFIRKKSFFDELNSVLRSEELDAFLNLQHPITREQRLFQQLCANSYALYVNQVGDYQDKLQQSYYFANRWAHQMKTPISVIQLLLQQEKEITRQDLISQIDEETLKVADGIQMMLSTLRIQKFELDFSIEKFELVTWLRALLHDKRKQFIRYHIFPKFTSDETLYPIESDQKWLRFVVEQLIQNALKYSEPNGYIHFYVEKKKNEIQLSIKDDGIGIKQEDLPRVFDAFFTGANGRKRQESTGMGLYLVKQIIDKLQHRITIDSQENAGTTVTLHFMLHDDYHHVAR